MTDRMSVFSNPKIIETLNRDFIPVAGNNWYHTRRKDDVGTFYHEVTNQSPRGNTKHTRQGHYIFSAKGKLLAFNNNRALDRREAFIIEGLTNWAALPEKERTAGGVEIPDENKVDTKFFHTPPSDGLILDVHTRALEKSTNKPSGMRTIVDPEVQGSYAALDHVWLQKKEIVELITHGEKASNSPVQLPKWFTMRLVRYHFIDNTRGEPPFWKNEQIKKNEFTIRKTGEGSYRLEAVVLLEAPKSGQGTERGFDLRLLGFLEADKAGKVTRFDMVALGDHWGQGQYVYGAREGRAPVGIAFQLGSGEKERDRIRPQGSHHLDGYYRAEEGW